MKDLSADGKLYFGAWPGNDILTGLSRRRGGRWFGSFVYCLTGTPENTIGSFNPEMTTLICTFAMCFVVENVRFGAGFEAGCASLATGALNGRTALVGRFAIC